MLVYRQLNYWILQCIATKQYQVDVVIIKKGSPINDVPQF